MRVGRLAGAGAVTALEAALVAPPLGALHHERRLGAGGRREELRLQQRGYRVGSAGVMPARPVHHAVLPGTARSRRVLLRRCNAACEA